MKQPVIPAYNKRPCEYCHRRIGVYKFNLYYLHPQCVPLFLKRVSLR